MTQTACLRQRFVDAHFEGMISRLDESEMRGHLDSCDACRARYRRRLLIAKLDPEALPAEERIGRGLGLRREEKRQGDRWLLLGLVVAAAAALFLFVRAPGTDSFAARGGLGSRAGRAGEEATGHASPVHIYRVPSSGAPRPLEGPLGRDEELAFAYENQDDKPYLMVFGVNERGDVYWFYPAWTDPSASPTAIPAVRGTAVSTLPEAIRHHFAGSRLEVHALFVDSPLHTREVEASLGAHSLATLHGRDHVASFELAP
jgi:hypothetical protein